MPVYYNEFDPQAAAWLRELVASGHLPDGEVDERSIEDVVPVELAGYDQCHFFAGIGGWPLALEWAGWTGPVWTGSCPCQPFSAAGKRGGADDPRALWWAFRWLIGQCRPPVVLGEQVASKAGRVWLAGVRADLEALGYGVGAADLCAAGVGAPHIRQRLWWVADRDSAGCGEQWIGRLLNDERTAQRHDVDGRGAVCGLGHASGGGSRRDTGTVPQEEAQGGGERQQVGCEPDEPVAASADGGLPDAGGERRERRTGAFTASWAIEGGTVWLPCADGKARRIEPGIEPLAHGVPDRVGLLRGYGNAIVPQVAAEFIRAFKEARS